MYRDPLAALRSQVEIKRAQLADQQRRVDGFRRFLPDRIVEELKTLGPRAAAEGDSLEALMDITAAHDRMLAVCDEALSLEPTLRAEALRVARSKSSVPPEPEPEPPMPVSLARPSLAEARAVLQEIAPGAPIEVRESEDVSLDSDPIYGARRFVTRYAANVRLHGAAVRAMVVFEGEAETRRGWTVAVRLDVKLGVTLPRLQVRPQRAFDTLTKALFLASEHEVGEIAFDRAFFIQGSEAGVALLSASLQRALLELDSGAKLDVSDERAVLEWRRPWLDDPAGAGAGAGAAIVSSIVSDATKDTPTILDAVDCVQGLAPDAHVTVHARDRYGSRVSLNGAPVDVDMLFQRQVPGRPDLISQIEVRLSMTLAHELPLLDLHPRYLVYASSATARAGDVTSFDDRFAKEGAAAPILRAALLRIRADVRRLHVEGARAALTYTAAWHGHAEDAQLDAGVAILQAVAALALMAATG